MESIAERLKSLALSDKGFLFDPYTGYMFTLNGSGAQILNWLKEGRTADEVLDLLCSQFEVTPEIAARDLREFLSQLEDHGLVAKQ